jgi:rhamnopyranosyl-N-acetylglucosaminyl-diphospho-decaprenol beta-1,3/1,4-galactofuranosyltransferase
LRVGATRAVELPDARLFFGFEELEYFLKIRAAGWRLVADGDQWRGLRSSAGRTSVTTAQLRGATLPPWRAYYSTRNEIVIAKRFASRLGVGRSIGRGLARTTRSLLRREWSSSGAHASGVIDGCFGRLGRRREPPAPDRTPTP